MIRIWKRAWYACILALLVAAGVGPEVIESAWAEEVEQLTTDLPGSSPRSEYQAMFERLEAAESRIQLLERGEKNQPINFEHHTDLPAEGAPRAPPVEQLPAPKEKKPDVPAKPTFPTVKLGGFFQLDSGNFDQSEDNRAVLGDIQNGVGFRRARLQAVGNVSEFTAYLIEMDFATAGRPSFFDVWGEQQNLPFLGNVRIGHFRQPTNMDAWTPIRQLEFLERSLPFQAFEPFRRVGIMAYDKSDDEMWTWAYGVYRTGGFAGAPIGDSRFATDIGDQGGVSVAGRLTHLLYYDEAAEGRYLLHVGGNYNYSRMTAGGGIPVPYYQARSFPEFFVGDPTGGGLTSAGTPFFVDTGRLAADSFNLFGVQLAGQYGQAHFQAEYLGTDVNQLGNPNVFYDGAYVQAGYFLTGENRTYNRLNGVFDRVTPFTNFFGLGRHSYICGWGAWELTGRWSYVNLVDPNAVPIVFAAGPPQSPDPGRLQETTLGINWYWNAYSKLQFNWMHCFLDNAAAGHSNCNIFAARFQVEF